MIIARLLDHLKQFLTATEAPWERVGSKKLMAIEAPIDGLQTPIDIPILAIGMIVTRT